jgi:hypothetical protein
MPPWGDAWLMIVNGISSAQNVRGNQELNGLSSILSLLHDKRPEDVAGFQE